MKKLIKLIPLILSFSLPLVFTACVNSAGSSNNFENKTVVFHGSFSIDELYLSQDNSSVMTSRSAQPTIPVIQNNKYYAKATNGTETINSEDIDVSTGTFSIPLKTGSTWTIEVGARGTSATNSSNTNAILLKDSVLFNPNSPDEDEPTKEYKFYLKPYVSDSGSGKINLRIKIQNPSGNKITQVEIVPKKCLSKPDNEDAIINGWSGLAPFWNSNKKAVCFTSNLDDFTISRNGFKSGIWEVAVNFKDSEEQLLYSSIQIICVYDHLETKTWESSKTVADSNELIVSSGEDAGVMYLTTLLVDAYGLTDFYVTSTGNDTTGNGSPMKPFATITKGIAVVNGLGRLDKTYTLHVKEGIPTQSVSTAIVVTSNLSIECYKDREGDRNGTATITSSYADGPILQIGDGNKTSVLTIDGIRKNNNTPDNISDDTWTGLQFVSSRSSTGLNTRGVDIKANGSLFMNGGSITGNSCNGTGAGVHISSDAYFIFTGGRITGNNSGTNQGGGIYVAPNGDLLMKGGVITGNIASSGAGIYVAKESEATGNITIGGACYISGNTANSVASNIYLPDDKLIRITGSIEGSTIGITTQSTPSVGNNIRFTDGYAYAKEWGQNGNNHPYKYFNSDRTGFSILTDPTPDDPATQDIDENNGDAYLGVSGGLITNYVIPTITISFTKNSNTEYKISATCSETGWEGFNSNDTIVTLQNNGVDIPAALWSYSHDTHKLTLQSALPKGNYVIQVEVTYAGYCYTGSYKLTKS